jgi:hypothetical protein
VKITEDVHKFAAEQKVSEEQALQLGLEQKAKDFAERKAQSFTRKCETAGGNDIVKGPCESERCPAMRSVRAKAGRNTRTAALLSGFTGS